MMRMTTWRTRTNALSLRPPLPETVRHGDLVVLLVDGSEEATEGDG